MSEVEPPRYSPESFEESIVARRPWTVALLLGSAGTPAAVIAAQILPPPFDAIVAWPLVLIDRLVEPKLHGGAEGPVHDSAWPHFAAATAGILLTWLFYVLLSRLVVRRIAGSGHRAPPTS